MPLYRRRLITHRLVIALSIAATGAGLLWLLLVLSTLLINGIVTTIVAVMRSR